MYSPNEDGVVSKALRVNLDDSIYGTFAEIGAGQETARHFFQAGRASHTIAKSISAYDMTFSDEIYGKDSRYVSQSRLLKMLDHEYGLLEERLRTKRGSNTRFFAFANTVATSTQEGVASKSHGWLGVRYQTKPGGPYNDIVLHVKLWDRFRLAQQEALGILGVNLLYMAYFPEDEPRARITQLLDGLNTRRIEVNMIVFNGPDLRHLDNRLMSLELVKQGLTEAVLFGPRSEVLHSGDELYRQPVLIQRGSYRPVTVSHLAVLERVQNLFIAQAGLKGVSPKVLLEVTMASLTGEEGQVDDEDFLHRVDVLAALGHEVLVSNFKLFYQMKSFLRQCTDQFIGIVMGAYLLPKVFDEAYYRELPGGILEGMSRLFDDKTRMFVYPHAGKSGVTAAASTFKPTANIEHLYKHLLASHCIIDAKECADIDTTIQSADVRLLLEKRDPAWKKLVPEKARAVIEERQLFGYRP